MQRTVATIFKYVHSRNVPKYKSRYLHLDSLKSYLSSKLPQTDSGLRLAFSSFTNFFTCRGTG